MTATGTVHNEGADIVYDYEGQGPILLTITGAGGAAGTFAQLAHRLADAYTVVRYDRRGNSRSSGDVSLALDMAQAARDAAAVIRAMGVEKAYVFGNSGGANIGLKLAEDVPEVITAFVVHEPPVVSLLPDAEKWQAFARQVNGAYLAQGLRAALPLFASSLVGFDPPGQGASVREGPGPNMDFFMSKEYIPISLFEPNLDAIARKQVSIVTCAGRRSADAYYARTARLIAERLHCPYVEFPGNHLAFMNDAVPFAAALREVLNNLVQGLGQPSTIP